MQNFTELTGQGEGNFLHVLTTENGAAIRSIFVPDKHGNEVDVVQGYEHPEDYLHNPPVLGAVVGRYAGRIAGADVEIDGIHYPLTANENNNTLHVGRDFYHERRWTKEDVTPSSVTYSLFSPHLDQGMPGSAKITVTYSVIQGNALQISYEAQADQDTFFNLTNHSYFNLNGHAAGDIADHRLLLQSLRYAQADAENIPTGDLQPVDGTPLDFTREHEIVERIDADDTLIRNAQGYDHCYALNSDLHTPIARARSERSGIVMEVLTDCPAIVFYTANFLDVKERTKGNAPYGRRSSFCLETGYFPDSPHKDLFPNALYRAGEKFTHTTIYRFSQQG